MNAETSPAPAQVFFKGRPGDPRIGEWVLPSAPRLGAKSNQELIAIMGCPDDKGVILNRGRAGAAEGPDSIRKHFYKMTAPMDQQWEKKLLCYDAGNIIPSAEIAETHRRARALAKACAANGATLISLGGGHDFAAPVFLGFAEQKKESQPKAKFGLTNADPHLDVRPLEDGRPHSGTPFREILDSGVLKGSRFLEFGIRANRNSKEALAYCEKKGVEIITWEKAKSGKLSVSDLYAKKLTALASKCDFLAVTFDMDGCADAEGTSAAPVLGFSAWDYCQMAAIAGAQKKVKLFELAEVAPPLDATQRSSRIAAEMIHAFLTARAS